MTEEDIVKRGVAANAILQDEDIGWFFNHLKSLILESISQTTPEQAPERERLYYQYRAADDLIGVMASYVDAAKAIQEKNQGITD